MNNKMKTLLMFFIAYKLHDTHKNIYKTHRYDKINDYDDYDDDTE